MEVNRLIGLTAQAQAEGWSQFIRTQNDEGALLKGYRFNLEKAERVCTFAETFCRASQGPYAGKPVTLLDWQRYDLLMPLFGWVHVDTGLRRFLEAYIEMAKKNGKSFLCAIIELIGLVADGEAGAEVYTAATARDQAALIHNEAAAMVRASPALKEILEIKDHTHTIKLDNRSFIRALAAEAKSAEGKNVHFLVLDELHRWEDEGAKDFYGALAWSTVAREQPLICQITTAGEDMFTLCGEKHTYAKGVLDGSIDDVRFFALIYGNPADADIDDPATWHRANPSLGFVLSEDRFAEDLERAKRTSQAQLAKFKRYRLGMWINVEKLWVPMEAWGECVGEVNESELEGCDCWTGIDISSVDDMTAISHVFQCGDKYKTLVRFFLPESCLQNTEHPNYSLYKQWADSGDLILTPGSAIDYDTITETVDDDARRFNVRVVHFDKWGAIQFAQNLEKQGLTVVPFAQTLGAFTRSTKALLKLILDRRLEHGGNPILTWQAQNLSVRDDDNGNIRPVKRKKGKGDHKKIDGMVAMIMALDGALMPEDPSMYEDAEIEI